MYIPFEQLPPSSRIWIYQADRSFTLAEEKLIAEALTHFCSCWEAHGHPLPSSFKIEFKQFIILSVDENSAGVSGCSIDGSVRAVKDLGNQLNIDFFDRTKIAFIIDGKIETFPLNQLSSLFESDKIKPSTLNFNNLTATKSEWEKNWQTTTKNSWLSKYLPKDALSV